jgi:hypothetical protein
LSAVGLVRRRIEEVERLMERVECFNGHARPDLECSLIVKKGQVIGCEISFDCPDASDECVEQCVALVAECGYGEVSGRVGSNGNVSALRVTFSFSLNSKQ